MNAPYQGTLEILDQGSTQLRKTPTKPHHKGKGDRGSLLGPTPLPNYQIDFKLNINVIGEQESKRVLEWMFIIISLE